MNEWKTVSIEQILSMINDHSSLSFVSLYYCTLKQTVLLFDASKQRLDFILFF